MKHVKWVAHGSPEKYYEDNTFYPFICRKSTKTVPLLLLQGAVSLQTLATIFHQASLFVVIYNQYHCSSWMLQPDYMIIRVWDRVSNGTDFWYCRINNMEEHDSDNSYSDHYNDYNHNAGEDGSVKKKGVQMYCSSPMFPNSKRQSRHDFYLWIPSIHSKMAFNPEWSQ